MRISHDDLDPFKRTVAPPPEPIEPRLSAADEAALIARGDRTDPTLPARRARVLTLVRRAATPTGEDAELLALLAATRALPLETAKDRLYARQRLAGIGSLSEPPPAVQALLRRHRIAPGDGAAFATALLGPKHDGTRPFHAGASGAGEGGGSG